MIEADEQGVAYQCMPNGHLGQMRQPSKHWEIVEIQVVSGVDTKTKRVRKRRGSGVNGVRRLSR